MSKDRNLSHQFLDLHSRGVSDRTFLGGLTLSERTRIFLLCGLLAVSASVGIQVYVDRDVAQALDGWLASERMAALVAAVDGGTASVRADEKRFLLKKNPAIAGSFRQKLGAITKVLETLSRMPESVTVRKHIATIRDGLVQYDQQFSRLVKSEKALGLADGSGLSRDLKDVTEDLQAKFSTAGYANLAGQVSRINQEGQETLLSGYKKGVEEIQKRYQTLNAFLKETKIPAKGKQALQDLLTKHETALLAMINTRFAFEGEAQRFDEIMAYLAPSLSALAGFTAKAREKGTQDLTRARARARIIIGVSSGVLIVLLIGVGLLLLMSLNTSIRSLAGAAGRLADGDRGVQIPGRGNSDAVGNLARALDKWLDNLADLDQLRQELEHSRVRLENTLAKAETEAMAAAEAARAALLTDEAEDTAADSLPSRYQELPGVEDAGISTGGPISSVSRQLASFSQYVTAAANDVERTEALIKGLDDATRQIEEMGSLVTAIRDQTNLLAFRSGPKETGRDNLVILSGEDRKPVEDSVFPDGDMAKRFDSIRDATDRAERTAMTVRNIMADVTRMAQEIAATASSQALEATSKLLSQSEYLQNMLDDIIAKVQPAEPGALSEKEPDSKDDARETGETPPKKA